MNGEVTHSGFTKPSHTTQSKALVDFSGEEFNDALDDGSDCLRLWRLESVVNDETIIMNYDPESLITND